MILDVFMFLIWHRARRPRGWCDVWIYAKIMNVIHFYWRNI